MVITYKGGAKYYYQGVPAFVAFNLMVAESFGKFVNEHIKPNYEFYKG
jgi:sorbitol-specific phosphotransferase system component IIC